MGEYETILYEVEDQVGWITFNNPEKMNPLNKKVWHEIMDVLLKTEKGVDVRVIVITGKDPAFSSGLNIKELSTVGFKGLGEFLADLLDPHELLIRYPKPMIAAINGLCYAGGLELTLFCDCAIASERAVMGFWENRRGLVSGTAFLMLADILGMRHAKELLLTGKIIDAQEAYRIGLVNKVVPHEKLHDEVMDLANEMKKVAPVSHKWTRKWFAESRHLNPHKCIGLLWEPFYELFRTEDVIEGFTAFLEGNREPKWKGK
ncbi:MAG: enoyl-CoA hydratase/isomerase family protein [Candidatus Jordarchaeum sp.]|uniref:enoyl-CoA hydratase/isomerase family protein n=1 Tax=Candidatus Jordarchaeum sp. TaxID=2823881 RepID=UPI004049FC27